MGWDEKDIKRVSQRRFMNMVVGSYPIEDVALTISLTIERCMWRCGKSPAMHAWDAVGLDSYPRS